MNHTEPKRLEIERLIAREIENEKAISLESHFKECNVCNEYYLSLCKKRDTFLRVYPYGSIAFGASEKRMLPGLKNYSILLCVQLLYLYMLRCLSRLLSLRC